MFQALLRTFGYAQFPAKFKTGHKDGNQLLNSKICMETMISRITTEQPFHAVVKTFPNSRRQALKRIRTPIGRRNNIFLNDYHNTNKLQRMIKVLFDFERNINGSNKANRTNLKPTI